MKKFIGFVFFMFIVFNLIDATAANRPFFWQLTIATFLTGPLNAMIHIGTPSKLKHKLSISPILTPSADIFPNLFRLRKAFPMIKREALLAFKQSKPIKNDLYFTGIADEGWKRFYLKWYGPTDPLAKIVCPETCKLLESMPEVHLGMFSILLPGSKIPPHFGPTRMCLRYHMGILTPNDDECKITIGPDSYSWRDGEDVIFDDTIIHKVQNNTNKVRIILFLDIERPQYKAFRPFADAMIKYGGAATTRTNEKKETVIRVNNSQPNES